MAKRSVDGSPWLAIAHDGPFYSDDAITEIIGAVRKKLPEEHWTDLADRLERAAERLLMERALQRTPTDRMSRKRFEKIDNAAGELLVALGAGPAGGIRDMPPPILDGLLKASRKRASQLGKSNIALIRDALAGVVFLQRLSRHQIEAATAAQKRSGNVVPSHVGDEALERWILELAKIYHHLWNTKPAVSTNSMTDQPSGPFFRFVVASGRAVGVKNGGQAFGKRIQRALCNRDK